MIGKVALALVACAALASCEAAPAGDQRIVCYNGGKVILDDISSETYTYSEYVKYTSKTQAASVTITDAAACAIMPSAKEPPDFHAIIPGNYAPVKSKPTPINPVDEPADAPTDDSPTTSRPA